MTKKQVVWLIVRLIGLGSLFNALRYVLIIFENILMTTSIDTGKIALSQGTGLISGWVMEAGIYFLIAAYLLSKGQAVFELLDKE